MASLARRFRLVAAAAAIAAAVPPPAQAQVYAFVNKKGDLVFYADNTRDAAAKARADMERLGGEKAGWTELYQGPAKGRGVLICVHGEPTRYFISVGKDSTQSADAEARAKAGSGAVRCRTFYNDNLHPFERIELERSAEADRPTGPKPGCSAQPPTLNHPRIKNLSAAELKALREALALACEDQELAARIVDAFLKPLPSEIKAPLTSLTTIPNDRSGRSAQPSHLQVQYQAMSCGGDLRVAYYLRLPASHRHWKVQFNGVALIPFESQVPISQQAQGSFTDYGTNAFGQSGVGPSPFFVLDCNFPQYAVLGRIDAYRRHFVPEYMSNGAVSFTREDKIRQFLGRISVIGHPAPFP